MKQPPAWFRALVRIVGTAVPWLLVRPLNRMFWNLGTPMAVRPEAASIHARARRETVTIGDRRSVVYRWGTGAEVVLLVHGWRGRASQFSALIEALESPERTIVAFDAPGNGDSPGDRTDLRDYLAVIESVTAASGRLELLVGHSFGVMAVFVAVREGVRANRIVSIAGTSTMDYTYGTFERALGLPRRLNALLRRTIERDTFGGDTGIWRRFVSRLDPGDQTPLLVIHDRDDRVIGFDQAAIITRDHPGVTTELYTGGLGHTRVLSDPSAVRAIVEFANEPAQTR